MEPEFSINSGMRHWWVFLIRGLVFLGAGIYILCSPVTGFIALGFMLGLVIFVAGIAELLHVYHSPSSRSRGWHLILGIIDIVLGIILMGHIAAGLTILRLMVGIWFLLRGISLFSFSGLVHKSWVLAIGGFITMVFGMAILFNADFGNVTLVLWTAIAFIISGIFNILQAVWFKTASKL
ncbi:MAG TPA: DUF308 domain-containing protein [Mucilaginibacter sp.]|nr:DUF308 domain-containing protein [Mucilaginibacter sp.]